MPKLLFAPASPYSSKVRMAAAQAGYAIEEIKTDTNAPPPELTKANPLGKIPVLVTDDGEAIYDSRTITHFLDRATGKTLYPRNAQKRLQAEQLEALSDGICDCLLAFVYERRFRPEEKVHEPWQDRQWEKAERALDMLEAAPPKLGSRPHAGHLALRACLGYLSLRFAGRWEKKHRKLVRWAQNFDKKFPELATLVPG